MTTTKTRTTEGRTRKKPTLESLINTYTTYWARAGMGSQEASAYLEIKKDLLDQQRLGDAGSFITTAETLQRRAAGTHEKVIRDIYKEALAAVQKAM